MEAWKRCWENSDDGNLVWEVSEGSKGSYQNWDRGHLCDIFGLRSYMCWSARDRELGVVNKRSASLQWNMCPSGQERSSQHTAPVMAGVGDAALQAGSWTWRCVRVIHIRHTNCRTDRVKKRSWGLALCGGSESLKRCHWWRYSLNYSGDPRILEMPGLWGICQIRVEPAYAWDKLCVLGTEELKKVWLPKPFRAQKIVSPRC